MSNRVSIVFVALVAAGLAVACGGSSQTNPPAGAAPQVEAATPEAALREFLNAVADSNLTRMAQLWGTVNGSAADTRIPPDFERRIVVMQAYLRPHRYRIIGSAPGVDPAEPKRVLEVELINDMCVKAVPFTMIRTTRGSWVLNAVDLNLVGNPSRPCAAKGDSTSG